MSLTNRSEGPMNPTLASMVEAQPAAKQTRVLVAIDIDESPGGDHTATFMVRIPGTSDDPPVILCSGVVSDKKRGLAVQKTLRTLLGID